MDWQKQVVRRMMEGAGEYPAVQLQFLLQRLEDYPDALPAIADAMTDMGKWYQAQAAGLSAVLQVRRATGTATPEK